jgi:very-long-chain ceramide synthase
LAHSFSLATAPSPTKDAMNDPSAIAAIQNEKVSAAHEWIEQNDENANGLEKKLNDSISQAYPARTVVINRKAKRKDDGPLELICGWIVEHQIGMTNSSHNQLQSSTNAIIGLAVNLLMLLFLTHLSFPRARRHTRKFFELSYFNPESGEYCAGWNDAWMVFYWIVVFTGLRAAVMDYLLTPFAKKAGAKTERDQIRFAEQAWLLIYYSVFWTLGMVRQNSPK